MVGSLWNEYEAMEAFRFRLCRGPGSSERVRAGTVSILKDDTTKRAFTISNRIDGNG